MIKYSDVSEERTVAVVKVTEQFQVDGVVLRCVGHVDMWAGLTARWPAASTGNRLVILKMETVYSYETAEHVITTHCKSPKGGHYFFCLEFCDIIVVVKFHGDFVAVSH